MDHRNGTGLPQFYEKVWKPLIEYFHKNCGKTVETFKVFP